MKVDSILTLDGLWRKYEEAWGFEVPQTIRQHYKDLYFDPDTMLEDLESDLKGMTPMVKLAYSKRAGLSKKAHKAKTTRMGPFMKRVNSAKRVTKALIDLGQDWDKPKHWLPVINKLSTEYPYESFDGTALRKEFHHCMSDIAVAGSVGAFAVAYRRQQSLDRELEASFKK